MGFELASTNLPGHRMHMSWRHERASVLSASGGCTRAGFVEPYRPALGSIRLSNAIAVRQALDQVGVDADRSLRELRASLTTLRDLLEEPTRPWGRQVVGGLKECIAYVLTKLPPPS